MDNLGIPVGATAITKVESETRRIDADELIGFAVALDCSPNLLLMPEAPRLNRSDPVRLTDGLMEHGSVRDLGEVWSWACGEKSLAGRDEAEFVSTNKPQSFIFTVLPGRQPPLGNWWAMAELVGRMVAAGDETWLIRVAFEQALVMALRNTGGAEVGMPRPTLGGSGTADDGGTR